MSEQGEHIDVEVLSDLVEGLLPAEREAELAAHLDACAECRDTRDALAEIRELLGDQPVEPMPADVVARIDGALALAALPPPRPAEAPRAAVPAARGHDPQSAVVSLDAARARRRRGPLLVAAAAAVAAVVLGFTVIVGSGDDGHTDSADKKSQGEAAAAPRTPSQAASPASPESAERPGAGQTDNSPQAPNAAAPHVYSDAGLSGQITRLLGERPTDFRAPPACVSAAVGPKAAGALAVDSGTYKGKPAYVVVLAGNDPTRVRVYIVDASCSSDASTASGTSTPTSGPNIPLTGSVLLDTEVVRG